MVAACMENFEVSRLASGFERPAFSASSLPHRDNRPKGPAYPTTEWLGPLGSQSPERSHPRHFHLLSDQDLDDLRSISRMILQRHSEIVQDWYRQYVFHLGDGQTLSRQEFRHIFEDALEKTQSALLKGDLHEYAAELSKLGTLLAEHSMRWMNSSFRFNSLRTASVRYWDWNTEPR
jgi:hypothetical protein